MTCRESEDLLAAEADGVLTQDQHARLTQHLAACPACRQTRANLARVQPALQASAAQVPVPDVETEWQRLQSRLHQPARRRPAPIIWLGAPLAAAAALALAFFVANPVTPPAAPPGDLTQLAHADFVEVEDATATPMVYVDKESGWLVVWAVDADSAGKG